MYNTPCEPRVYSVRENTHIKVFLVVEPHEPVRKNHFFMKITEKISTNWV